MTKIYVDADACPVKDETFRVADRHDLRVHVVANSWMRLPRSPLINQVVVSDGFDAADDWIAEHAGAGDIVVTADIALAQRCLGACSAVISPNGKPFEEASIGMAMAMRGLMADLRSGGDIVGHNPAFTNKDRSLFLQALENAVQKSLRQHRA